MTVLYWADPADDTHATIGLDLSNVGSVSGFAFTGIDWGDINPEITWHDSGDVPGAEQVRRHPGPVLAEITLIADFSVTDYDTLIDNYRLLGQFLETEGVLVWQPDGQTFPQYFDTYPSPIPALYRGIEGQGRRVVEALQDEGYTFGVWHHPYPRRDPVTLLNAVALTNAVGDNVATFTNPGSALSEARLEVQVDGGQWVVQLRAGFKHGDSGEFAADLSGFVITPNSTTSHWARIDRHVFSPADPAAFAGTYRVIATARLGDDVFHLRLDHGATRDTDQPLDNQNEEVILDGTDLVNFTPYVEINLGLVTYDATSPDLVVEIHAWSEGGGDFTDWGNVYLVPADDGAFVYRSPRTASEVFKGALLALTGGAVMEEDDGIRLEDDGAIAEARPAAGKTLAIGPHTLDFRGSARNRSRTKVKLSEMKLLKNGSLEESIGIFSKIGRAATYYGGELIRRIDFRVLDDTDLYRFQVEEVAATSALRWTQLAYLSHRFHPPVTDGRRLVADAGTRQVRIEDPDGARIAAMHATGLPFLEPGPGAVAILAGEFSPAGYSHVDERGTLHKTEDATEVLVTLVVTPRDLQA